MVQCDTLQTKLLHIRAPTQKPNRHVQQVQVWRPCCVPTCLFRAPTQRAVDEAEQASSPSAGQLLPGFLVLPRLPVGLGLGRGLALSAALPAPRFLAWPDPRPRWVGPLRLLQVDTRQ